MLYLFDIISSLRIYRVLCHPRGRRRAVAAILWPALMDMYFVHVVERRGRELNPALLIRTQRTVTFAIFSPLNSMPRFQHHRISSRRKRGRLNVETEPPPRKIVPLWTQLASLSLRLWVILVLHSLLLCPLKRKLRRKKPQPNLERKDISELDQKWSERFNRLSSRPFHLRFELFHQTHLLLTWPGPWNPFSSRLSKLWISHQLLSALAQTLVLLSSRRRASWLQTVLLQDLIFRAHCPDGTATKQKLAGKLKSDPHQPKSSISGRTGPDTAAVKHKSTGKPQTDPHRPTSLSAHSTSTSVADRPSTDRPLTDWPKPAYTWISSITEGF